MASPWQKYRFTKEWSDEQVEQLDEMLEDIYAYLGQSPLGTSTEAFDWSAVGLAEGLLYIGADAQAASVTSVATGQALISSGVNTIPAWGQINLTTHVTGTLPVTNGGTGTATAFTTGSVVFAGASGVYTQDNAGLFFDTSNDRLGIGVASPADAVDVRGTSPIIGNRFSSSTGFGALRFYEGSTLASSVQAIASSFATAGRRSDLEFVTLSSAGDIVFRPNDTEVFRATSGSLFLIGAVTAPGAGSQAIVFGDGTAPSSLASNTAALYANDVGGTVKLFGVTEAGATGELTMNSAALTSGRVALVTTDGLLVDDAGITYDATDNRLNVDQLRFPGTQNPSTDANTLDDYEEGSWTPTLTGTGGGSGQVYTTQLGTYQKTGRVVVANFRVKVSTLGTITTNAAIGGLPFTSRTGTDLSFGSFISFDVMTTSFIFLAAAVISNSTQALIFGSTAASTASATTVQADYSNTSEVSGTLTYFASA